MTNDPDQRMEAVTPEVPQETAPLQDVETLQQLLAEEKARAEKHLDNWRRVQADFINHKRRMDEERTEQTKLANYTLILNLLPIVDDLERALNSVPPNLTDPNTLVEGMRLIQRKLQAVLEAQGLFPFEAVGQLFDPNLHEAVMYAEGDAGRVIAEWQKGYKLHDRVIRPAMVTVGKKSAEASTPTDDAAE